MKPDQHPLHSVSVAGAVVDNFGLVLVIRRRDNDRWEPPGGILEHGESILEGLVREVHEETGLVVEPEKLTGVYQNTVRNVVALVFLCRPVGGQLVATNEAVDAEWLNAHEIRKRLVPAYAIRLLDALVSDHQPPAIREHDGVHFTPE